MKAVILAAGSARRLSPLADNTHKCLLEVGEKGILEHQLDALDRYGVAEALIVVGFLKEQIQGRFGNQYRNMSLTYIENPDYATTNTVYSLYLAREFFSGEDFLYLNADVVFHHELIRRILLSENASVLGVEVKPCGEEEVKVIVNNSHKIQRIGKKIDIERSLGEFIGIAKFAAEMTNDFIEALKTVIDRGEKMAFFEKAVDLILCRHDLYYEDITDIPVIEIDFPEDLEKARKHILPRIKARDED
ncbi:MAG: phosphocholine cytidylyltransferase family protein [Candidatus Marinimicrobia bacterium]|nr:phosphocholine cytidylyltransferase family protein [Candidatus Neomarinimicrobiota bacterium]